MNAWGIIIIALAAAVLYWADKHEGTLADLGAIGAAAAALKGISGSSNTATTSNDKPAGSAADDAATAGSDEALTDIAAGL